MLILLATHVSRWEERTDMEGKLYAYHAEMCKVFPHPKRLELIELLREGEFSVGDLSQKLELSPANLSQHLAMMRERRILACRKEGNTVYYRIVNPKLMQAFDLLRQIMGGQLTQEASL